MLARRLENRGDKTIDILHYNHNFILVDGQPYGPDYRVELPFRAPAPIEIAPGAWFREGAVEVDAPLGPRSLWRPLFEGEDPGGHHGALVRHQPSGAAVSFTGDAPLTRFVFWAVERAVCPEPFVRVHLAPGEAMAWSTSYRFFADG